MAFDPKRKIGPKVKKLIFHKMSVEIVPAGGGIGDVLDVLRSKGAIASHFRQAAQWVFTAIDAVKKCDDNHYGDDDEAIAAAILERLERKKTR